MAPRHISAKLWHDALLAAGVVSEGEKIRRIVIDAEVGEGVKLYVERWGDERLLDVVPTLDGIQVRAGRPEADAVGERDPR